MSALRLVSAAARRVPRASVSLQRRGYAEAVSDKIKLSLVLPHQVRLTSVSFCDCSFTDAIYRVGHTIGLDMILQTLFSSQDVVQVNIAAATGDMGILANHVPSIEPLRPGVVEVIDSTSNSQKWFGAHCILLV